MAPSINCEVFVMTSDDNFALPGARPTNHGVVAEIHFQATQRGLAAEPIRGG